MKLKKFALFHYIQTRFSINLFRHYIDSEILQIVSEVSDGTSLVLWFPKLEWGNPKITHPLPDNDHKIKPLAWYLIAEIFLF
jgi:hypothetical protein